MKKCVFAVLLVLALLVSLCPAALAAEEIDSGTCGEGLTWRLDSTGVLTISGTGPMWDFDYIRNNYFLITLDLPNGEKNAVVQGLRTTAPWTDYNGVVTSVVIGEGVTSVGSFAFTGMVMLRSAALPESLERIGTAGFQSCVRLQEITIPDAVTELGGYAFSDCLWLRRAHVGAGIREVTGFSGCIGLEEVTLPAGLESIGPRAFYVCSALKELEIPATVTYIGSFAFYGTALSGVVALGPALVELGTSVFGGAVNITGFTVDEANPALYAADGCIVSREGTLLAVPAGVTEFTVPDGVKEIPESLFDGARRLVRITLPEGLEAIGNDAFYECYALREVRLPSSLKSIGDYAFYYALSLTELTLPEGLESIGREAFRYAGLRRVRVPDSVTELGRNAFRGCDNLEIFELGGGVTELTSCIMDCHGLRSLILPAGLKEIGYGAVTTDWLLRDVYFRGSAEEWAAVEIEDDYYHNVTPLTEAAVHLAGTWTEADVTARRKGSGEITWRLTQDEKVLIISGEGPMPDYAEDGSDVPWRDKSGSVRAVIVEEGVTHLGSYAFNGWGNTHIYSLPSTLRSIGTRALSLYYDDMYPVYNYIYFAGSSLQWRRVAVPESSLGLQDAWIRYGVQDVPYVDAATAEHAGELSGTLSGDMDLDGALTAADARAIFALVSAGTAATAGTDPDVNGDGKLNNRDALLVFRAAVA